MVQKLSPMGFQDVHPTRCVNLSLKIKVRKRKALFAEPMTLSWVLTRQYSCVTIWRFICYFLEETNITRRIKMDKSRIATKVPRRKANQENQAPTLITVKDFNSECFIDEQNKWIKPMFQGHCCFAVKDKIFFSLSRVITAPDVVLVTHMQTEGHRHV